MSVHESAPQAVKAAATASISFFGLTLAQINELVTIGAGCMAILTGFFACTWYGVRIYQMRQQMKRDRDE